MTALAQPESTRPDQTYQVTPLELFFDLVFIFAVSQLSHHLLGGLSWRAVGETAVLLCAVYAIWNFTSWDATIAGVTRARTRLGAARHAAQPVHECVDHAGL